MPEVLAPQQALRLLYVHAGTVDTRHGNRQLQLNGGHASLVAVSELHAINRLRRARGWLLETEPEALGLASKQASQTAQRWQGLLLPSGLHRILTVPG